MSIKFLYFDLGKVLVNFDIRRMIQQMADVAEIGEDDVARVLFDDGLQAEFELGHLTDEQFHQEFCRRTNTQTDFQTLIFAAADFFQLNTAILPIVASLNSTGHRLGILSNTCGLHWRHCLDRYSVIGESFPVHVLSCEVGAAKPNLQIYRAAAQRAGVNPAEIFFVDDLEDNVNGALAAGFDAVQYSSMKQLADDLRKRGIPLNV
jgi:HAD superfamily hydrolase (TIGR01509 family)